MCPFNLENMRAISSPEVFACPVAPSKPWIRVTGARDSLKEESIVLVKTSLPREGVLAQLPAHHQSLRSIHELHPPTGHHPEAPGAVAGPTFFQPQWGDR